MLDWQIDLSLFDLLLPPLYIFLAWVIAYFIKQKNIAAHPEYKYFIYGLLAKIVGAIGLGLIYYFYYNGGDTTCYFQSARAYINLFFKNQANFFEGVFGNKNSVDYYYFDENTGYPQYGHTDPKTFFTVTLLIPVVALGFKSYFASAVLVACITFSGLWKLYQTFLQEFPNLKKELAIAVLFIPSCIFWGSGLNKDSLTLSATGWFTYAFYHFFIKKERNFIYAIEVFIATFIIISIKPYIFFALLPGAIIWLSEYRLSKIRNKVLRVLAAPLFLSLSVGLGFFMLSQMDDFLGVYALDKVLDKAAESNFDQKQAYYNGHSFDIGDLDAKSPLSMLSKTHLAIAAALFRPYLWDVKNSVMLLSALENTYIMILTFFLVVRLKFFGFFSLIGKNSLLLFSILFSLFFAFSVGLATSNFGSLVRIKIPCIPFFLASLFVLRDLYEKKTKKKLGF
ncbi:MAG: hypothetical protein ACYDCN_09600 [Bacteroidia bacterium]